MPTKLAVSRLRRGLGQNAVTRSPFVNHVMGVVGVRAFEQVPASRQDTVSHLIGSDIVVSDARANVAYMPDDISRSQDFAGRQFPGDSMGAPGLIAPARATRSNTVPQVSQTRLAILSPRR